MVSYDVRELVGETIGRFIMEDLVGDMMVLVSTLSIGNHIGVNRDMDEAIFTGGVIGEILSKRN